MNLQQLEYIIAVDTHRHFAKAAEACFITQATLSMMIKKLEQELQVTLFDRSKQPVVPTEVGVTIIEQARIVLREAAQIKQLAEEQKGGLKGLLRIGIIPTLAPYLLPLFLSSFLDKHSTIQLKVIEQTTDQLLHLLATDKIDVGIMAIPLSDASFKQTHLFYEEFKAFVAAPDKTLQKKYILPEDINVNKLWLLEEGHCLRSQMLNLCELQKSQAKAHHLDYEAGSIESLIKITELNKGVTIIPELATLDFSTAKANKLRSFKPPVPVRQIGLVTYRHFIKKKLLEVLAQAIVESVKKHISLAKRKEHVLPVYTSA